MVYFDGHCRMEIQGTVPKLYPEPRIGPSIPLFIPASGDGRDFMIEEKKYEYQGLTFYQRKRRVSRGIIREILLWLLYTAVAVFLAYCVVSFFGFRVSVIGPSMEPTLEEGDSVLVNRISGRIGAISRGDVIAFYPGGNTSAHPYIKRVVGIPGDTVSISSGVLSVNGVPENRGYDLIEDPGEAAEQITLGDNEYFVLGDNRNNSEDSRSAGIGNVTSDMIIGKVYFAITDAGTVHTVK